MMRHSNNSKIFIASVITLSAAILHLALFASVRAEAPPGESDSPPAQATEKAYNPPKQPIGDPQTNSHYSLSWLGLVGLAGLAGLTRRK